MMSDASALVLTPPPSGTPYPDDVRSLAFETYLRLDGNMIATTNELGLSRANLYKWRRQDDWDGRIKRAEADLTASAQRRVHRLLRECVPELIETMLAISRGQVPDTTASDRRLATRDLLDRAGYTPVKRILLDQRVQSLNLHATLDPDTPPRSTEDAVAILQRLLGDDQR